MVTVKRTALEPATVGYEKTWLIRVYHRGEVLDLTSYTVTAAASAEFTSETDISVTATKATQVNDDRGVVKLTIASGQHTAARAGRWYIDVYIAESGGNAQPIQPRLSFTLEPKQTEA